MSQTERVEKRGDRVSTREMKPTEVQFDLVSSTQGCTECVSLCVYLRLFRPLLLCVLLCVCVLLEKWLRKARDNECVYDRVRDHCTSGYSIFL